MRIKKHCVRLLCALPKYIASLLRNYLLNMHAKIVGAGESRLPALDALPGKRVCVFGHPRNFGPDGRKNTLRALCGTDNILPATSWRNLFSCDYTILHYLRDDMSLSRQTVALLCSIYNRQPLYFVEPSFLSSIYGYTKDSSSPLPFRQINSYFVDDMGFYFDSVAGSRLEQFLNSPEYALTDKETELYARLIREIVKNRLTKYNFQPEARPAILDREGAKVLIVDQTVADASVWRARGTAAVFKDMLRDALSENPGATVYIKTHPDMHLNARNCYYQDLSLRPEDRARVAVIDVPANPYTIIEKMDAVYVCTSQLGFEALMAGKRVKTYGMPVYAGWGLTEDTIRCERRTRKRTLEEVFYALYGKFAVHVAPDTGLKIDLESHITAMIRLTAEYHARENA